MFQLTRFSHNTVFFRNQNARYARTRCSFRGNYSQKYGTWILAYVPHNGRNISTVLLCNFCVTQFLPGTKMRISQEIGVCIRIKIIYMLSFLLWILHWIRRTLVQTPSEPKKMSELSLLVQNCLTFKVSAYYLKTMIFLTLTVPKVCFCCSSGFFKCCPSFFNFLFLIISEAFINLMHETIVCIKSLLVD